MSGPELEAACCCGIPAGLPPEPSTEVCPGTGASPISPEAGWVGTAANRANPDGAVGKAARAEPTDRQK